LRAALPDVVVLDLMLAGLDGTVLRPQSRELSDVPILILTAREDSYDEVSGIEQGAGDVINKRGQPRVLLARLRALMRRAQGKPLALKIEGVPLATGRTERYLRIAARRVCRVPTLSSRLANAFSALASMTGEWYRPIASESAAARNY
jgi:DNA-binding response OmpR family regulator